MSIGIFKNVAVFNMGLISLGVILNMIGTSYIGAPLIIVPSVFLCMVGAVLVPEAIST
jgi:hypothetical protein